MDALINALNSSGGIWWRYVLHAAWQASLLAVVVLLVVRLGRRWSSSLRYWLLVIVLVKFAMPPLFSLPTGLFSRFGPRIASRPVEQAPTVEPGEPVVLPELPTPDEAYLPSDELRVVESEALLAPGPDAAETGPETAPAPIVAAAEALVPRPPLHWKAWALLAYVAGVIVVAVWTLVQLIALRRTLRRATPVTEGGLSQRFARLCREMSVRRTPRLLLSPEPVAPMVFGLFRPVVMVSASTPESELDTMLAHELAHVRRRDTWVNWFQILITAVWWFNPVVWVLSRALRKVREDCCDDVVLAHGRASNDAYCDTLLHAASRLAVSRPIGSRASFGARLGFADRLHPLGRRLKRIMDRTLRRAPALSVSGILLVAFLAIVLLPGLACRRQKADDRADERADAEADKQVEPGSRPELNAVLLDAAKEGNLAGVRSLLRRGAYVNTRDDKQRTPLHLALGNGHEAVARFLIEEGADIQAADDQRMTPLHLAAHQGWLGLTRLLAERGARVDPGEELYKSPLGLAARRGHADVVQFLLDRHADLDARGRALLLSAAAGGGHAEVVRFFLDAGTDANTANANGWTPLHQAAVGGHHEVVRLLVEAGADESARTCEGPMPLHSAMEKKHRLTSLFLIEHGADVTSRVKRTGSSEYYSPSWLFWQTARRGWDNVVKALIDRGLDPTAGYRGGTPLHVAAAYGHDQVVKILLGEGVAVDSLDHEGRTGLFHAVQEGRLETAKVLIAAGADPNASCTPLHAALIRSNVELVKLLLGSGANPELKDAQGRTPLSIAVQGGDGTVVRLLLDGGADPDLRSQDGFTPLLSAIRQRDSTIAAVLIKAGADVNLGYQGHSPLHVAVSQRDQATMKLLLANGADPDARDQSRNTPLHAAAELRDPALVRILLKSGADVNAQDGIGRTPLYVATYRDSESVVKLLIQNKADVNAKAEDGNAPLHVAARTGAESVAKLLVQNKADVNARDRQEATPLHSAAGYGHIEVAKVLVEAGADISAKDKDGRTPLELASASGGSKPDGRKAVAELLRKHGATESPRPWGPGQATGEPDTPEAGDSRTAWASKTEDGQDEWLMLEYTEAVTPAAVKVYETFNPGALYKVSVFDPDGKEVEVWTGDDPTPRTEKKGVSEIKFTTEFKTKRVKLYLKSKDIPGWNEIDAVGLVDAEGHCHWATSATASSTYAK